MSTKELIEAEIETMDEKQLNELYPIVNQFAQSRKQGRVGGLNPGSITTTEDFDEPLPDEFWLGAPVRT